MQLEPLVQQLILDASKYSFSGPIKDFQSYAQQVQSLGAQVNKLGGNFDQVESSLGSLSNNFNLAVRAVDRYRQSLSSQDLQGAKNRYEQVGRAVADLTNSLHKLGRQGIGLDPGVLEGMTAKTASFGKSLNAAAGQFDNIGARADVAVSKVKNVIDTAAKLSHGDVGRIAVETARTMKASVGGREYNPADVLSGESHKVILADVFKEAQSRLGGMGLEEFKSSLLQGHRNLLSRVDMPSGVIGENVGERLKASGVQYLTQLLDQINAAGPEAAKVLGTVAGATRQLNGELDKVKGAATAAGQVAAVIEGVKQAKGVVSALQGQVAGAGGAPPNVPPPPVAGGMVPGDGGRRIPLPVTFTMEPQTLGLAAEKAFKELPPIRIPVELQGPTLGLGKISLPMLEELRPGTTDYARFLQETMRPREREERLSQRRPAEFQESLSTALKSPIGDMREFTEEFVRRFRGIENPVHALITEINQVRESWRQGLLVQQRVNGLDQSKAVQGLITEINQVRESWRQGLAIRERINKLEGKTGNYSLQPDYSYKVMPMGATGGTVSGPYRPADQEGRNRMMMTAEGFGLEGFARYTPVGPASPLKSAAPLKPAKLEEGVWEGFWRRLQQHAFFSSQVIQNWGRTFVHTVTNTFTEAARLAENAFAGVGQAINRVVTGGLAGLAPNLAGLFTAAFRGAVNLAVGAVQIGARLAADISQAVAFGLSGLATIITGAIHPALGILTSGVGSAMASWASIQSRVMGEIVSASSRILGDAVAGAVDMAGQAFGRLVNEVVALGTEYERTKTAFEVFTGSARSGLQLFRDMQDLAVKTPYNFRQLADVSRTLLGMGVPVGNVTDTMRRLGDIAAGDSDRLHRLALAYGEVMAEGRFTGQRMRQFAAAGVGIDDFRRSLGMTGSEFRKFMHGGEIGADRLKQVIEDLTERTGRFGGMSEKQSRTVGGAWSNVVDRLMIMGGEIGEGVFKKFDVVGLINKFQESLATMTPAVIEQVISLFEKLGAVVRGVFDAMQVGWDMVRPAIEGFLGPLENTAESLERIRQKTLDVAGVLVDNLVQALTLVMRMFRKWLKETLDSFSGRMFVVGIPGMLKQMGLPVPKTAEGREMTGQEIAAGIVNDIKARGNAAEDALNDFNARFQRGIVRSQAQPPSLPQIVGGVGAFPGLRAILPKVGEAVGPEVNVAPMAPSVRALIRAGQAGGMSIGVSRMGGGMLIDKTPSYLNIPKADVDSMTEKIHKSLREGISPLDKFVYEMKVLRQAFPGEGLGDVRQRVRGEALLVQDLISKRTKEMRDDLPRAAMQDSAEALDMINKSQIAVPDTLEGIKTILEGMGEESEQMNRHMENLEGIMRRIEQKEPGFLERLNIK